MAFKLMIDISDDGSLDISHEGQIDPIILLGSLKTVEHSVLCTMDVLNSKAVLEAMGAEENSEDEKGQEE